MTYYDKLVEIERLWHGYGIPISFLDPISGLIVEGLIFSPKKRKEEEQKEVSVYRNFDCQYLANPVKIIHTNIFPSRRNLTKLDKLEIKDFKVFEMEELLENPPQEFFTIKNIYDSYRGVKWTAAELSTMLNRKIDSEIVEKMPFLIKSTERMCRIENKIMPTYEFSTPEKLLEKPKTTYSINSLNKEYSTCKKCPLFLKREEYSYSITPGRGNKNNPKIFILGEAPGINERDTGIVFHPEAPAGKDLLKVMTAAGIDQDKDCYITNSILCWTPPKEDDKVQNGKPADESMSACNSRLKMELAILKPKVILLLGSYAYKAFFGRFIKGMLSANIGWIPTIGDFSVFLTYHPSYIVRQLSHEKNPEKRAFIKNTYLDNFIEVKRIADGK